MLRRPPITTRTDTLFPDTTLFRSDDDADLVVGLGLQERVVQLDEHPAVLRVAGLRPVQHDAGHAALGEDLVGDELVVAHDVTPIPAASLRAFHSALGMRVVSTSLARLRSAPTLASSPFVCFNGSQSKKRQALSRVIL